MVTQKPHMLTLADEPRAGKRAGPQVSRSRNAPLLLHFRLMTLTTQRFAVLSPLWCGLKEGKRIDRMLKYFFAFQPTSVTFTWAERLLRAVPELAGGEEGPWETAALRPRMSHPSHWRPRGRDARRPGNSLLALETEGTSLSSLCFRLRPRG